MKRWTKFLVMPALLATYAALRDCNSVFENDELQHLHVVWSWTRGLTQYKDIFDNHTPLYHLVTAGLVSLLGLKASPDFVTQARLLSLPVFAATLAVAYRLLKNAFSLEPEEALTAACLLGLTSPFLAFGARPEPLWIFFFFSSLLVLSREKLGLKEGFYAGLINGAGAMVSMKTLVLLLPAQLLALVASGLLRKERRVGYKFLSGLAAGLPAVPLLVAAYFNSRDAFKELVYYTISYNTSGAPFHLSATAAVKAALYASAVFFALKYLSRRAGREALFYAASGLLLGLLFLLYPIMESQTVLPLRLLLYGAAAALLVKYGGRALPAGRRTAGLLAFFAAVLAFQLWNTKALTDVNAGKKAYIGRILQLAGPGDGDYVMDAKGESIFGRRPFYYGLELLAQRRMAAGQLSDTIPAAMKRTATKLLLLWYPGRFTPADMEFFQANYVPLPPPYCELWAAGKTVTPGPAGRPAFFDLEIPADYAAACSGGGAFSIDGKPYHGKPVRLDSGRHAAAAGKGCGRIDLIWAKAAEGAGT